MSRIEMSEPSGYFGAPWADASTWTGDGLCREVFFFRSEGVELYGSLFAAAEPSRPFGVVACGSWGVEADRTDPLLRSVALAAARFGGAALVFHYPGYGDSFGDLASVSLADLAQAGCDAVSEASRRRPGLSWTLAGIAFGASVACLAQRRAAVDSLLLVQPALRPSAYFEQLAKGPRRLKVGSSGGEDMGIGDEPGMAFGYPIPSRIAAGGGEGDRAVLDTLDIFRGEGAAIYHDSPGLAESVPASFERIEVAGGWRFGAQNHPALAEAIAGWLDRHTGECGR